MFPSDSFCHSVFFSSCIFFTLHFSSLLIFLHASFFPLPLPRQFHPDPPFPFSRTPPSHYLFLLITIAHYTTRGNLNRSRQFIINCHFFLVILTEVREPDEAGSIEGRTEAAREGGKNEISHLPALCSSCKAN